MNSHQCSGYTILELMTAITICAILATAGISNLNNALDRAYQSTALQQMLTTLDRARSLAVIRGVRVAVCIIDSSGTCVRNWIGDDLVAFADTNENRLYDKEEEIIYRQQWSKHDIYLAWNRREPAIIYQADGSAVYNGTLKFFDKTDRNFQTLIISKPGRARIE